MEPWEVQGPQFRDPLGVSEPVRLVAVDDELDTLPDAEEGRGQE